VARSLHRVAPVGMNQQHWDEIFRRPLGLKALSELGRVESSGSCEEKLKYAMSVLCNPNGVKTQDLLAAAGMKTEYHRKGHGIRHLKLPEVVHFVDLNESLTSEFHPSKLKFIIGMERRGGDPESGRIVQWWAYSKPDGTTKGSDNVTCFGAFSLDVQQPRELLLYTLQSCAILKEDKPTVLDELRQIKSMDQNAGSLESRIKTHQEWAIPWTYPDRLMLYAAVTVILAKTMEAKKIKVFPEISEESRPSANYRKITGMLEKFPPQGIQVQGYKY